MATKYEVITKDQLRNIICSMSNISYVSAPYEASNYFSPAQLDFVTTMINDVQRNILNSFTYAISTLDHNETVTIDRCFLCDKNDTGGPKCPV